MKAITMRLRTTRSIEFMLEINKGRRKAHHILHVVNINFKVMWSEEEQKGDETSLIN